MMKTTVIGSDLLNNPWLNKGTAFAECERDRIAERIQCLRGFLRLRPNACGAGTINALA
jgi:hypothetical protein